MLGSLIIVGDILMLYFIGILINYMVREKKNVFKDMKKMSPKEEKRFINVMSILIWVLFTQIIYLAINIIIGIIDLF